MLPEEHKKKMRKQIVPPSRGKSATDSPQSIKLTKEIVKVPKVNDETMMVPVSVRCPGLRRSTGKEEQSRQRKLKAAELN